jgi:hypothetical protein
MISKIDLKVPSQNILKFIFPIPTYNLSMAQGMDGNTMHIPM